MGWPAHSKGPHCCSDSAHLLGTHLCTLVLATEPPHQDVGQPQHTGSLQAHPSPCRTPGFGVLVFSASQAGTGSFKHFLSVLTPNLSQPQVWGSKDSEGGMKLKNMHLHCDCKVLGDSLKKWESRDGNCSLDYRWENYFGEYHSCTKPSILIFKNMGE